MDIEWKNEVVEVKTTQTVERATLDLGPEEVKEAIRDYVLKTKKFLTPVRIVSAEVDADWNGQEYYGFSVTLEKV